MDGANPGALSGIAVLDLSTRLSGAYAARLLGDLGADVVLAEPAEGHPLRAERPFLGGEPGLERSLLHAYANGNKRSVRLDLSNEHQDGSEGDRVLAGLVAASDIVVVSDLAMLDRIRPSCMTETISMAVTPYGLTGPMADAPGNDLTAYALSGWAATNGLQGRPPLKGSMNQVGYLAGVMALNGALAALNERRTSGTGQEVDVSELEALTITAGPTLLSAAYEGAPSPRPLPDVFGGPVPVQDGHISVTFSRAHFWRDAMNALGLEQLAEDPRYTDTFARRQHRSTLAPMIEEKLAARGRWDLFEHLGLLRCVCGVVLDMGDLDHDPHLEERGLFVETELEGVTFRMPGAPFRLSATPWASRRPAPRLGEHTQEVIVEWLQEVKA